MARSGQRIHVPTLDAKFVQQRNLDGHWLIEAFNENISLLNKVADSLANSEQPAPSIIGATENFILLSITYIPFASLGDWIDWHLPTLCYRVEMSRFLDRLYSNASQHRLSAHGTV